MELFERANQIAVFLITFTKCASTMTAQTRRVLVPQLDNRFEELVMIIDVAILEGFQKLGYASYNVQCCLQLSGKS